MRHYFAFQKSAAKFQSFVRSENILRVIFDVVCGFAGEAVPLQEHRYFICCTVLYEFIPVVVIKRMLTVDGYVHIGEPQEIV